MIKKSKVLFFGPYPAPITGQSIAFKASYDGYVGDKILFNTTKYGNNQFINSIYCILILPFSFIFKKFDTVYFTCTRSSFGCIKDIQLLLLCEIFRKRPINHLHGADFNFFYNNSGFLKKTLNYCYQQIDTSIVLLNSMRVQFNDFPQMNIVVIENCYSSEFDKISIDFKLKKTQVIYLSNLIYSKGIFVFLESAEELLKQDSKIIIKIAGIPMGDEFMSENEVSNKFNEIYLRLKSVYKGRIQYLGKVKGLEKINLLSESSIFVLPTFYKMEAFPITIIEAMYFGNAIVTTNHNYLPDIVSNNNGRLIQINSSIELINQINNLFLNGEDLLAVQKYNREYSIENFSSKKYNTEIDGVINNCIQDNLHHSSLLQ
jgi:glycosyltransferase involved in cell wall biosynthesis